MNFNHLFNHLENINENNKKYYKDIHNILYFNNENFLENPDFLNNDYDKKNFFKINVNKDNNKENDLKVDNFKFFSQNIDTLFDIQNFNISHKFNNITECILNIIDYKNINGRIELFQKMLRDFDSLKLFKKFNFQKRKICKKKEIRDLLLSYDDVNNIFLYFIANYLSINLIILKNDKYDLYCENDVFEPFKTTLLIYKYDNNFYFLSSKNNNSLFTSDDDFVLKIYNIHNIDNDDNVLEIEEMLFNINIEQNNSSNNTNSNVSFDNDNSINYRKMKIVDLKKLCKNKGLKNYSKLKKEDLIKLLE